MALSKYVSSIDEHADCTCAATTVVDGICIAAFTICIALNGYGDKAGEKLEATVMKAMNIDICDYVKQREMHMGMHTVIGGLIMPMPESADSCQVNSGNSSDDASPKIVHKSDHDGNGVKGRAFLLLKVDLM